jgi:hypothetical protein
MIKKYQKRRLKTALPKRKALFVLDDRTNALLDHLSESFGISRSKAIRYAVKYAFYSVTHFANYTIEKDKPLSRYMQKKYNLKYQAIKGENIKPVYRNTKGLKGHE